MASVRKSRFSRLGLQRSMRESYVISVNDPGLRFRPFEFTYEDPDALHIEPGGCGMPFFSFSSVIEVGGAGVDGRLIVLLAVDALGGTIFLYCAGGEQFAVAIECDRDAELCGGLGVGSLDVGRGIPGRAGAGVNVDRAGVFHGGVRLIPVDALGAAILKVRADGNGVAVAAHGQNPSELVVLPRL